MDNHQTATLFFSLPISACSFLVIARRTAGSSAFALLCSASGSERNAGVQSPFPGGFFFFQLGVFVGGFHQRQVGLLVADGVETIAQTFDFILFDFFHGDLIY
jgi:hypothetical protein